MRHVHLVIACILLSVTAADAAVTTWSAPDGANLASDYAVHVDGVTVPVYAIAINDDHVNWSWTPTTVPGAVAIADIDGPVHVSVTLPTECSGAEIRPRARAIAVAVHGREATFDVDRPGKLSLLLHDPTRPTQALHLFLGAPERDAPTPDDASVRYFGPGLHEVGLLELGDVTHVHIAGGAVVRGLIKAVGKRGVRITGRGILDGSRRGKGHQDGFAVFLYRCPDALVEGITIGDSPSWNVVLAGCAGATVRDVRIVGARATTDGIDVCNSEDVLIDDCFVRNWDDGVSLKGVEAMGYGPLPTRRVTIQHSVFWSDCAWSNPFGIGGETFADEIAGWTIRDCDVVFCQRLFSTYVEQRAQVHDIRLEDVRVEMEQPKEFMRVHVRAGEDGKGPAPTGSVRGLVLERVSVRCPELMPSALSGFSDEAGISGVRFVDVVVNGAPLTSPEAAKVVVGEHVAPVSVETTSR